MSKRYASYATQSDSRIRALGTVSAACAGRMTRNGGVHSNLTENAAAIMGALQAAGDWRTSELRKHHNDAPMMFDAKELQKNPADAPDSFFRDASEYYGTERGFHPRCTQRVPPVSYDLMVSYDSFTFQHLISPRPLLMIAGSEAQTLHYSWEAVEAAKDPKEIFVINRKNHFDLYDDLTESGPKLVKFFGEYLD